MVKIKRRILAHIPHAGELIPDEINFVCERAEIIRQHNMLKDDYVLSIIPDNCDYIVKSEYSRIVCDVERFLQNEPMQKYGMGFCYERGYNGKNIRKKDYKPVKELEIYHNYHNLLNMICSDNKSLFVIDIHSYSETIIPVDMIKRNKSLPDICLGFDDEFIAPDIVEYSSMLFLKAGFSLGLNYPYKGSLVPNVVMDNPSDYDCLSLMIEVKRDVFELEASAFENEIIIKQIIEKIADHIKYNY